MSLILWFTKNWANTTEPTHPDLRPLDLPVALPDAVAAVARAVADSSRWRVESADPPGGIHLTRRTRAFRFVDDIRVTLTPVGGGTRLQAESRSRVGTGDFGQNRRNILELWHAVTTQDRDAERSADQR